MDASEIYRPSGRAAFQDVAGETVVVHVSQSKLLGLNPTGAFVWKQLDGRRTVGEVAQALAGRYHIAEDSALRDVEALLDKLLERDLVERVNT